MGEPERRRREKGRLNGPYLLGFIVSFLYLLNSLLRTEFCKVHLQALSNIAVPGGSSGTYVIYVWLQDAAGNIDFANRASATISLDTVAPVIAINAPDQDTVSRAAPTFSLTVTDNAVAVDALALWYTLDGGATNHTLASPAGAVDADKWASLPNGLVTIRFYARDPAGNEAYAEITLTKGDPAGGGDLVTQVVFYGVVGGLVTVGAAVGIRAKRKKKFTADLEREFSGWKASEEKKD